MPHPPGQLHRVDVSPSDSATATSFGIGLSVDNASTRITGLEKVLHFAPMARTRHSHRGQECRGTQRKILLSRAGANLQSIGFTLAPQPRSTPHLHLPVDGNIVFKHQLLGTPYSCEQLPSSRSSFWASIQCYSSPPLAPAREGGQDGLPIRGALTAGLTSFLITETVTSQPPTVGPCNTSLE